MYKKAIAKAYIQHLADADLEALLDLFAKNARVISPVYGHQDYQTFYTQLFADTNHSELQIKGIFEDTTTGDVALYFNYQWTLKNDTKVDFEVVDILEFNEAHQIEVLTIIYDTVRSRELVQKL